MQSRNMNLKGFHDKYFVVVKGIQETLARSLVTQLAVVRILVRPLNIGEKGCEGSVEYAPLGAPYGL
jgi:hypothetical protein